MTCAWLWLGCTVLVASRRLSTVVGFSGMAVGVSGRPTELSPGAAAGVSGMLTGGSSTAAGVFGLLTEGSPGMGAGVSGLLMVGSPGTAPEGVPGLSAESSRLTGVTPALPPKTLSNNAK